MKNALIALSLLGLVAAGAARGQDVLELEIGRVTTGYNDVAIPGDTGTRLSLSDDLEAGSATAFRLRYSHLYAGRHWLAALAAPLTVESRGTLDGAVDFDGTTFPGGTHVDATFRFDSYRLVYRYRFAGSGPWRFGLGGALKVRDAAIKLEAAGLSAEKTNTGVVPLLSFDVVWAPAEGWRLLVDGEALAAPQGRAEDVLFAVQCDLPHRLSLTAGYRILEGGADNDEVYTFSLFHYLVAGAAVRF